MADRQVGRQASLSSDWHEIYIDTHIIKKKLNGSFVSFVHSFVVVVAERCGRPINRQEILCQLDIRLPQNTHTSIDSFLDTGRWTPASLCDAPTTAHSALYRRLLAVPAVDAVTADTITPPKQSPRGQRGKASLSRCWSLARSSGSSDKSKKNRIQSNRQKIQKPKTPMHLVVPSCCLFSR